MVAALHHRGPDDRGYEIDARAGEGTVALGHARLSIIDLGGGKQPISNEDGSVVVVANGEIYNYAELTEGLRQRGHVFKTSSDCEAIVHLWEEEGEDCVQRLRGMFAFVLYDRKRGVLFGARDRFGQKPFFWTRDTNGFAFASEIKALLPLPWLRRELDAVALDQFLFYQFVPHPRTLFEGVHQLPPAHTILVDADGVKLSRYWSVAFRTENGAESESDAMDRVEASVRDAISSHLVADVPVGVFLSGGIDSSLAAVIAHQESGESFQSFSISFPGERQDESEFAKIASRAAKTEHREFAFRPGDLAEQLDGLARIFDQPLADPAALPLTHLSEAAASEVKVVFTGDGGDELFAGYEKYRKAATGGGPLAWLVRTFPRFLDASSLATCGADPFGFRKLRSRIAYRNLPIQECLYFKGFWEAWDRQDLYRDSFRARLGDRFQVVAEGEFDAKEWSSWNELDRMLATDQLGYLPGDLLPKTDFATMAHGLESRAPFLDHELAEVAGVLPPELKASSDETKVALRRIADKVLPKELTTRRKHGFAVPLSEWFRRDLKDWVRDRLLDDSRATEPYFHKEKIERVLDEHQSGRKNRASKIYTLLFFELWYRHYLS